MRVRIVANEKVLLGGLGCIAVALFGTLWFTGLVSNRPHVPSQASTVPCEAVEPAPGDIVAEIEAKMPRLLDDMAELRRNQDRALAAIERLLEEQKHGTVTHREWAAQYGSEATR